jgi:hypothetical protein
VNCTPLGIVVSVLLATASAIGVAALAPVSVSASSGPVTATLTAIGAASENTITDATAIRLTISRNGVIAFNGPLRPCRFGCAPEDPSGGRFLELKAADLDGDGEAEVLVDRSDGFTPCCTLETAIMRRDPFSGRYTELDRHWGESYRVADLGGDRAAELVTGDLRFYERFAPRFAGFQLPRKILALRAGALVDVTRRHPGVVRRDTRSLDRLMRSTDAIADGRRTGNRTIARAALRPQLAAYTAEERLLGRRAVGDRRLAREVRRHRVSPAFRRALLRFLTRTGYR